MAPQKLRNPVTHAIHEAVDRARTTIGTERAAEALGISTSLLRQYGDPDQDKHIPGRHIAKLEALLLADGHQPFLMRAMRTSIDLEVAGLGGAPRHSPADILDRVAGIFAAAGEMAGEARAATATTSPGGRRITPREAIQLLSAVQELVREIDPLRMELDAIAEGTADNITTLTRAG